MWTTGRQNESSTSQIRRNFDLLAIPRRTRALSLDSIDSLATIESHRQHRLNYLEKRAKFEETKDSLPVSPISKTPSRPSGTSEAPHNSSGSSSSQPSESTADALSEMLEKITSELDLLQQNDIRSTSREPITRTTVVERYIPTQIPMRATIVSTGSEKPTLKSSKNRVSFDSTASMVVPDVTDHKAASRSSSFQFQRPSTFLRRSSSSLAPSRRELEATPSQPPRDSPSANASLGRHGYSAAQNFHSMRPLSRQLSSTPSTPGQDYHTPRPIRRHVSFSSVPLGDVPRRSTTSSVPVSSLIKKFSIDE